ncbi:23S rRNA (pseudouridine(1915)-N(3))-methyltransferase RlmH [soil metagenome]
MRYHVIAVGALKRGFYADGVAFYAKRLRAFGKLELTQVKEGRARDPEEVKRLESAELLRLAQGHKVLLDEGGKLFSSVALADHVAALELRGVSSLSLLVGGAGGHSSDLKKSADETWSLSPLTLPHDLARLVLLEQLYRLETLRAGHPYHRE